MPVWEDRYSSDFFGAQTAQASIQKLLLFNHFPANLVIASQEENGGCKEPASCDGEQKNCMAISPLHGGRSGSGVVLTLRAALRVGWARSE
jgi:hypothetical protein